MNLKISLDLDDTVFDWTDYYVSRFGIPKSEYEITRNVRHVLKKDKQYWYNQPVKNRPDFIPKCYCTARVIPKTWIKGQLSNNNLPIVDVYQIPGYGISKTSRIKKSGSNVHIDDSMHVFLDCNLNGIPCLLMDSANNQEWPYAGRLYSLNIKEIEDCYSEFMRTVFPEFKKYVQTLN